MRHILIHSSHRELSCLRAEWFFARNCRRRLCCSTPRLCVSRCGSAPAWRGMDDGSIVRPTTFPRTEVRDAAEGGPGARRAGAHEGVLEMTALKVQQARSSRTRPRLRQLSAPARAPIAQAMPPIARIPSMTTPKLTFSWTCSSRAGAAGVSAKFDLNVTFHLLAARRRRVDRRVRISPCNVERGAGELSPARARSRRARRALRLLRTRPTSP